MAIHDLKARISRLPEQPGVYIFLGAGGETLYVGKARVLRDRVRNYLAAQGMSPRIDALLRDAAGLDVIVTDSVTEALALVERLPGQHHVIFDDFHQAHRGAGFKGTGLGLATCKRIVERHGGSIFAMDNPQGYGTSLVFTLPAAHQYAPYGTDTPAYASA